jgi:hypothetical protein
MPANKRQTQGCVAKLQSQLHVSARIQPSSGCTQLDIVKNVKRSYVGDGTGTGCLAISSRV